MTKRDAIELTPAEIQSGLDRVRWAEGLILQLPDNHDGRNSWLLNYGTSDEADRIRRETEQHRLDYSQPGYEPHTSKEGRADAGK